MFQALGSIPSYKKGREEEREGVGEGGRGKGMKEGKERRGRAGKEAQVVEHLLSKCEALDLIPSYKKERKEGREGGREGKGKGRAGGVAQVARLPA
jgi:hypothetical protein